jgi:hypothetical protein
MNHRCHSDRTLDRHFIGRANQIIDRCLPRQHPLVKGLPVYTGVRLRHTYHGPDFALRCPFEGVDAHISHAQCALPEGLEAVVEMGVYRLPVLILLAVIIVRVDVLLDAFLGVWSISRRDWIFKQGYKRATAGESLNRGESARKVGR